MNPDVLIAGAGPVGLAAAIELARFGLAVRIVDKAAQPTDKSKALVLWSRTLELLDRSGAAAALVDAGLKVRAANIVAGSETIAHIPLDDLTTPHSYGLMLPQSDTERLLTEHLQTLGVSIERSVELTGFTDNGSSVACTLLHADGSEESVDAAWLLGCDGAHSTVRHTLGMQFVGDTLPSDWILADVHLAGIGHPGEVGIYWSGDGVLATFPIGGDRYRVIADLTAGKGEVKAGEPTLAEVQVVLDLRGPGGIIASNPVWLAGFHINERKVADYRKGRVFLCGDAAHIHSPAGGQGMNTGIQDACNLAWKLALVHRGAAASEPLLSSYSTERSYVGEQVLKNAGRLTEIGILRGDFKQSLRNHLAALLFGLSPVRHAMASQLTELSIGYPEGPLVSKATHLRGGPAAGERAPIRSGESLVGAQPRFALFASSGNDAERFIACFPDLMEPTPRAPFHEGGLWLVRPDGYIAFAGDGDAWAAADAFIMTLGPGRTG